MKYPEDFIGKIINGDCLEIMKQMPNKCIDLVLTDPPYGIGITKKNWQNYKDPEEYNRRVAEGKKVRGQGLARPRVYEDTDWDSTIPSKEYFDHIFRISKNQIIFGGNYFVEYLKNSSCWLVWDKDSEGSNFADCELVYTSFKTAVRKFTFRWRGMLQEYMGDLKEDRVHPTQKPAELIKEILLKYSKDTDVILDCFSGSGSTLVAAKQLGRNYIGIEISPRYVEIANQRLRQDVLL